MEKSISKQNPDYSEEVVRKIIGDIWYNDLTEKKRKSVIRRDRK